MQYEKTTYKKPQFLYNKNTKSTLSIYDNIQLSFSHSFLSTIFMKTVLFFFCCLAANALIAQNVFSGSVLDSAQAKPLEYATVGIFDTADTKKPLEVVFTNSKGEFRFAALPKSVYNIEVSNVGFRNATQKTAMLTAEKTLPLVFKLVASSAELAAVTVSALRPILERKDEKIIYNAENDPSNTGVSTMELLPFIFKFSSPSTLT